jgi:2-polyprenyl-6-methoxyphenol hydroxylase-like FAD-dependent oxidoreductase
MPGTSSLAYGDRMAVQTEVLIVGGGAVGLALATELGWRGRHCIVLDEGNGVIEHPRTGGISVRTMEHCRRWGIADAVRNNRFPQDYRLDTLFCTSVAGFEVARVSMPSMAETPVPPESPERKVRCPQFWFDPMLSRSALDQPTASLRYHTRFRELHQDENGVTVQAQDLRDEATLEFRAQYVVGCDGPLSLVREQLGIAMSGIPLLNYSVNILFSAPTLLERAGQDAAERFIIVTPEGTWGNFTVVDGRGMWRLTLIRDEERLDLDTLDAAAEIRRGTGIPDLELEVHSIKPWRRTQLVADSYADDRVFLCGDSLHTMSPTGGFGVNTGIGDAVDLGWKLDAVLSGWGGPDLLASYEQERRPVGVRNAQAATANFKGWLSSTDRSRLLEDTPEGEQVRAVVGQELLEATHAEWESLGVILGYRYEDSPICLPDGTPPTPDDMSEYVPTARPGSRAPHAWLPDGRSTLDLFGHGFTLLHAAGGDPEAEPLLKAAAAAGVPLTAHAVPADVVDLYQARFTLVRPDGHVAWRSSSVPDGTEALLDVVRGAGRAAG